MLSSWEAAWGNSDEEREWQRASYGDTGMGFLPDRIGSFETAGDGEKSGLTVNRGSRSNSPVVAAALGIIRAATGERREAHEEVEEEEEDGLTLEGESDSSGSRAWDLGRIRGRGPHSLDRGRGSGRGDRVQALLSRREAARLSDSSEDEEGGGEKNTSVRLRGRERGSAVHTRNSVTDAVESVGKEKVKGASYPTPPPRKRDDEEQGSAAIVSQAPSHTSDPLLETPNTILTRMRARLMQGDGEGGTSSYPPSPPLPSAAINSGNTHTGKKSPESNSSSSSSSNSISSRSGSGSGTGTGSRVMGRSDVRPNSAGREQEETCREDARHSGARFTSVPRDEEVLKRALGVDSDDGEGEGEGPEEDSAASDERYQRARATLFNLMHGKSTTGK